MSNTQYFYATFSPNQAFPNGYISIEAADYDQAHTMMCTLFGLSWGFILTWEDFIHLPRRPSLWHVCHLRVNKEGVPQTYPPAAKPVDDRLYRPTTQETGNMI